MTATDKKATLTEIKRLIEQADYQQAFYALQHTASPDDDVVMQSRYAALFKKIPTDQLDLHNVRLALVATSTIDHFTGILPFWLATFGLHSELYLAPYNTLRQTILDTNSSLYAFKPDVTMLFTSHRDIFFDVPPGSSQDVADQAVRQTAEQWNILWDKLHNCAGCHILQNNADIPHVRSYGNYEAAIPWGRTHLLQQYNLELTKILPSGVTLFDLDALAARFGKDRWFDERYWHHSQHAFSLDALGLVAHQTAAVIAALKGRAKKCIVLDLDNTLWGGIIGDDGWQNLQLGHGVNGEAFVAFQKYLLELKNRGIILAVCSKNEDAVAREPFLHHPDMRLRLDDIAVFVANWNNKADNIRYIAQTLNLGLDALVFLDDNPAERELVRRCLPMVAVPELGEDPTRYIRILDHGAYFETIAFSTEDQQRSHFYRDNARRAELQQQFSDLSGYLQSLDMTADVGDFDELHLPRIAQLINKSNQFHLTTTRYSETQLLLMMQDPAWLGRHYSLSDKFGRHGLISAVLLHRTAKDTLDIDTWVMSCRVLAKTMEQFVANDIITCARRMGCRRFIGRYRPTAKNHLVADLYQRLRFTCFSDNNGETIWTLDLDDTNLSYETFIRQTKVLIEMTL